ncbi:MAG: DUF58 domain-containing protein [Planctomycetota bacterium]
MPASPAALAPAAPLAPGWRRRRTRFLREGLVFVGVVLALGLAAGSRPNNLLVWVFGVLVAALLVSGFVSGFMMMPIRALWLEPRRGRVGEPLLVRYEVSNHSRRLPAFDIHVGEFQPSAGLAQVGEAWVLHVGPRETVHAEAVFRPARRGRVRLDAFEAWTSFPFGLMRKSVRFDATGEVLIHPEIRPLRPEVLSRVTAGGLGGQRLSSESGGSDDFFGVREYRPGDSVRHIAWKRLAGTGRLATIERSRAVPPRVRILLDLRRPTSDLRTTDSEDPRDLEERAIVLAASFVALADRLGYEHALSVAGLPIAPMALRRGHFHREKIMSALAALDLDEPRLPGNGLSTSDERTTLLVIHPDRVDISIAPEQAWHFTARELDALADQPAAAASGAPA